MTMMTMTFKSDSAWNEREAPVRPAPILDLTHLRKYTLGAGDLEREILALFLAELPNTRKALEAASTRSAWHMAAHTLKGSALAVGAGRLAAAGSAAELLQRPSDCDRASAITRVTSAIDEVRAEIVRLRLI